MKKVKFFDSRVRDKFSKHISAISTLASVLLIFFNIPENKKIILFAVFSACLFLLYCKIWWHFNNLQEIELDVEGSKVSIKTGDLFLQPGLKCIAFNEYFDTKVDEKIISSTSLNGQYINKFFPNSVNELDKIITEYEFEEEEKIGINDERRVGKKVKYSLGTTCVIDDYLLTAFSHFDKNKIIYLF